jgi:hypothetical protein
MSKTRNAPGPHSRVDGTFLLPLAYPLVQNETEILAVRIFLITLVASTVASVLFWNFGLAAKISPDHPMIITMLFAGIGAGVLQQILIRDRKRAAK